MTSYIALLRAVNVGGTGKLPMDELRKMCVGIGFEDIRTYIASGNVVFRSGKPEDHCRSALEGELERYAGKPVGVFIRTAGQMADLVKSNPFPGAPGNRVTAHFLKGDPPADLDGGAKGWTNEEFAPGNETVYVHYPDGMGKSKLVLDLGASTARNMNTVTKLAEMAA